jgi:transcriptional regulator with XRE-family HTH domain
MDFARLQNHLNDRGWTQAELARRMAPLLKESRIGRDTISKYVRGKVLPLRPHLEAMAKVFGVESRDLLPTRGTQAVNEELAPRALRYLGNGPAWVRINQEMKESTALKLFQVLAEDDKASRAI